MRFDAFFPLAPAYRGDAHRAQAFRESMDRYGGFPYSERHVQCVWFDPRLRPASLRTAEGEVLEVEDPGVWNLEAGPDFLGAVVRVGAERRRVAGDVEIHLHPLDWRHHGHADDPRYANVRVHVSYLPGLLPQAELPDGAVQVTLREALAGHPSFSFESIDTAAYPFGVRATEPPCRLALQGWPAEHKQLVLDAAGHERLRRKAERLHVRTRAVGAEQALYEEVLAALGYQHNRIPARRLAVLLPVDELRVRAAGSARVAEALLLGVAGLLPETALPAWSRGAREHLRELWDQWWRHRPDWEGRCMEPGAWRLAGIRPANHPARRLVAAAHLFLQDTPLAAQWMAWDGKPGGGVLERVEGQLGGLRDPFWSQRLGWGGERLARPVALLGADRVHAMIANIVVPFLAAMSRARALDPACLADLPVEELNSLVRQTAHNLFGPAHPPVLYRTGVRRQGLLQIFHDYCLNDRSRCAGCTFPALLAAWKQGL